MADESGITWEKEPAGAGITWDQPAAKTPTPPPGTSQPGAPVKQTTGEALATAAQADALSVPSAIPTAASVLQGFLNMPEGALQAAGINLPKPLQSIRKEGQKAPMPALGQAVGEAANPINWFYPESRLGLVPRVGIGAVRGGVSSLLTPQKDARTFWKDAPTRAAIGAAVSAPFSFLGAPVAEDAAHLLRNDIRVTPTAMVGGGPRVERLMSAVPGFGEAISHGGAVSLGDYNRRLYRWALDGLGGQPPDAPIQAGSGGLNYVFNQITQRLNRANGALALTPYATPGFAQAFVQTANNARASMSPAAYQQFEAALRNYFREPVLNANGRLVGRDLAKTISDFTGLARDRMRGSNLSPDDFALARAYRDVVDDINQFSTGPLWARNMRDAARTSYAKYMTLEAAASGAGVGAEGVITPRSFLAAQQRNIGRGRYQRDDIPFNDAQAMKDLSETANRVLSGARGYPGQHVVSPLIGLEYLQRGAPFMAKVLPALAAWWAAHSGPGMQFLSEAAQSPGRVAAGRAIGPATGVAGEATSKDNP